jgi:putative transposase
LGPATKKQLSQELVRAASNEVEQACKLLGLPRSQFYYKSNKDDQEVIDALQKLAADHPVYDFRKLFAYLRRAGHTWNHKNFLKKGVLTI